MRRKGTIERYSADRLAGLKSEADWAKVDAMSPQDAERLADEEDGPLPEGWERTVMLGVPEPRQAIHIRVDADVLRWFKEPGPGYQTRINEALRAFVSARRGAEKIGHSGRG